jgi:hypothetical protein
MGGRPAYYYGMEGANMIDGQRVTVDVVARLWGALVFVGVFDEESGSLVPVDVRNDVDPETIGEMERGESIMARLSANELDAIAEQALTNAQAEAEAAYHAGDDRF